MALVTLNVFSEALGMQTEVQVILPQRSSQGEIGIQNGADATAYKCLYLLHGLSDDQTIWLRRTSIERYAAEYGICVVMPCADKSFYCDMKYGMAFYTFIAKELPRLIREFFRVSDKREDNFVAGLSMGGYGALKLALREPDTFAAGAGLSPVGDIKTRDFTEVMRPIFGDDFAVPDEDDLLWLADHCKDNPNRPRLFMGIGTEDFLYENTRSLKAKLEQNGYDFTYRESAGAHTWEFWDEYIQYVLEWMFKGENQ